MDPPPYAPALASSCAELLDRLGLGQLQAIFERELLDLDALLLCDDADLEKVGVPLGARRKIGRALVPIRQARQAALPLGVSAASVTFEPPRTEEEGGVPFGPEAVELLDLRVQPGGRGGGAASAGRDVGPVHVSPALLCRRRGSQFWVQLVGETRLTGVWLDESSPNIRPIGWARLYDLPLTVPAGSNVTFVSWDSYLVGTVGVRRREATQFTIEQAAPPGFDPRPEDEAGSGGGGGSPPPPTHQFRDGMRLEATDMMPSSSLICVATVAAVRGPQVLIHFDGWSTKYDYWAMHDSPKLFPCGYCLVQQIDLQPPKGRNRAEFVWRDYLNEVGAVAAPIEAFPGLSPAAIFASYDPIAGASSVVL